MAWRCVGLPSLLVAVALTSPAYAGGDGLGVLSTASTGDPTLPWSGARSAGADRWVLGGGLEYLRAPVVRVTETIDGPVEEALLTDVAAMRLSTAWSPGRRVAVGLDVPVVLAASGTVGAGGPGLGTAQLSASFGLVGDSTSSAWVGVTPFVMVPFGKASRWIRDHAPGAGALVHGGGRIGPLALTASAGPEYRDVRTEGENLAPSVGVRAQAAATLQVTEPVGVGLDVGTRGMGGSYPLEAGASVQVGLSRSWSVGARVSRGVIGGAGSPDVRATAGVLWRMPRAEDPQIVRVDDEPEVRDEPSLVVSDPLGRSLVGAVVFDGPDEIARTDAMGRVPVRDLPRRGELRVELPGFLPGVVEMEGRDATELTLDWAPVPALLDVVDQRGNSVVATLTVTGPDESYDVPATDGSARLLLEPGEYTVDITAEGYSGQSRTLVAEPGRSLPILARVLLASDEEAGNATVAMVVRDATGAPLEGVEVRIDGVAYGTTGSGGVIALSGLSEGSHRIEAWRDRFISVVLDDVALGSGVNEVPIAMERQPGGLRLRVQGPDGPVTDAVVRLIGPARLPAYPLGDNGARMFQLRPGRWSLVVTSEVYGLQTTEVLIDPEQAAVSDVDVFMQDPEGGTADLTVLAVDRDGRPLSDASVLLDGVRIGETASGGQITVPDLFVGERRLTIEGEMYEATTQRVRLVEGPQEVSLVVPWVPGAVEVVASAPRSQVSDGMARFSGRKAVDPLQLDEAGRGLTAVTPGAWTVVVTSPQHGMAQQPVSVAEEAGGLTHADVVFLSGDAGTSDLSVSVRDPEGQAVVGADVRLAGIRVGSTGPDGRLVLQGIADGPRVVSASAPMLMAGEREVRLREGANEVSLALPWAPGAVRVVAAGPDGPVEDAVVRFIGPEPHTPIALGDSGERRTALGPGHWQGLASSPTFGLAQTDITIDEDPQGLRTVRFDFEPLARGEAELLVRVIDPNGHALAGAAVEVGDGAPRVTGEAGAVLLRGVPVGTVSIALNADRHYPRELTAVEVVPGSQERVVVLTPVPGTVRAQVRSADGEPVNGQLRFLGPSDVAPVDIVDGRVQVDLPPGAWRVLAAAEGLAVGSAELDIPPGAAFYDVDLTLEPARLELTADGLVIGDAVLFDVGQATLRDDAASVLDEVSTYLLADPSLLTVQVQGHTDSTGSLSTNYRLSTERAERVMQALIDRGVPPERLTARGFGPSKPIADNSTDGGRARNRRVQFVVTASGELAFNR